ncbi:hypothetical protein OIDMADRAFT_103201 [Oidiodendron maius Zn]|uniref:Zinc finger PHD-type domain-containing protein n=1 Tax=Oidiodendron maius (strain Zn) TaxID=913774 RepID=A0A0C3HHZ0_OIDMZ|nr:hypothetical protein OIDMADRAFT_103201 [Oidiodendron maius Zn]
MVSSRKRGRREMEAAEPPKEPSLLERIRNTWEFANLVQWIFIFGRVVKIDESLDVEDLEMECLKSRSTVLPEIGLALLKFVSSHRGLTQYVAKAPGRNPFGTEEEPANFNEFDIFTKIRVLQQLTVWTLGNPDRIRDRMNEQKDSEQTMWRIEPFGWDAEDRTYFLLDDNRLYRRTDPPPTPVLWKPKKNSKKAKAALRSSKRRKVSEAAEDDSEPGEEAAVDTQVNGHKEDDSFGGMKWECVAVTLDEFNAFITSIAKSRDPNEKALRARVLTELLPALEKQEEARKRKVAQKERELLNLEKLATAKRSSRIAGRLEQQKQEEEARDAERRKAAELAMAKKEQEKWLKLEKERESRMITREQRLKEREARRILHEEDLANLSEDSKKLESGQGRLSERHLKAEIERKKQALEELAEDEDWIFDCICGMYGQVDDGTHSIACEKCSIWQHSKCVGVSQEAAERDDFHFICNSCDRRAKDAERAKTRPPIKIKLSRPGSSSTATPTQQNGPPAAAPPYEKPTVSPTVPGANINADIMVPGEAPRTLSSYTSNVSQPPSGVSRSPDAHAFSSPHPYSPTNLPPPAQRQSYSFVNGNTNSYGPNLLNAPRSQGSPVQNNATELPPVQASPSPATPQHYGVSTPSRAPIAQLQVSVDGSNHRKPIDISYPSSSTPLSTPVSKPQPAANLPPPSSPFVHVTPISQFTGTLQPHSAYSQTKSPHYEQRL